MSAILDKFIVLVIWYELMCFLYYTYCVVYGTCDLRYMCVYPIYNNSSYHVINSIYWLSYSWERPFHDVLINEYWLIFFWFDRCLINARFLCNIGNVHIASLINSSIRGRADVDCRLWLHCYLVWTVVSLGLISSSVGGRLLVVIDPWKTWNSHR